MSDRLSADLAALQIPRDQGPRPAGRAPRTAGDGHELVAGPAPGARLVRNPPATRADGYPIKERKPEE
ncbi:MAG: hypothetical protein MUF34_04800 [Polyangiaceae bacterium]|nr:hypothetical protein [Polyangiaceae bacterium]